MSGPHKSGGDWGEGDGAYAQPFAGAGRSGGRIDSRRRRRRSEPDPVRTVRSAFRRRGEVAAVQDAGIDLDHGTPACRTASRPRRIVTESRSCCGRSPLGAEVLEPGEEFQWSFDADARPPRPIRAAAPPAPTVRVVRADYFTTKGQGFLYVEARTTQGAQTDAVDDDARERHGRRHGVRLAAHDEPASWTRASTCSTATCSR